MLRTGNVSVASEAGEGAGLEVGHIMRGLVGS